MTEENKTKYVIVDKETGEIASEIKQGDRIVNRILYLNIV
jgi:hypothetical protein